jgi:hypothetical protein
MVPRMLLTPRTRWTRAFPFQHPDAPAQRVSVPMQERLFGQGIRATFANVVVTIEDR